MKNRDDITSKMELISDGMYNIIKKTYNEEKRKKMEEIVSEWDKLTALICLDDSKYY